MPPKLSERKFVLDSQSDADEPANANPDDSSFWVDREDLESTARQGAEDERLLREVWQGRQPPDVDAIPAIHQEDKKQDPEQAGAADGDGVNIQQLPNNAQVNPMPFNPASRLQGMIPIAQPVRISTRKTADLHKIADSAIKSNPIPAVRLKDEESYVSWLKGVDNLLTAVGLASLTLMNKYSSIMKNGDRLTQLRHGILRGIDRPDLHPKFTQAVTDIMGGFYSELIPADEDQYGLNCRYYAMLYVYPNLERYLITTIIPTVDILIRDSFPDHRSTPDALKIIYGGVSRRFVNENISVIEGREDRVKKLELLPGTDPASLAKTIRHEVDVINTASHQTIINPVRQVLLLYKAVKRSSDAEHYKDTLKKFRELKRVRENTFSKFSQELHADYIREIEQPAMAYRANAAKSNGEYQTPYAPPGYCFDFVKTGECKRGRDCTYKHEDPEKRRDKSSRGNMNRSVRHRESQRNPPSRTNGDKKKLIRAFVSALLDSDSDDSQVGNTDDDYDHSDVDKVTCPTDPESGNTSDKSDVDQHVERKAMSSRQSKVKKKKFPKRKGKQKQKEQRSTSSRGTSKSEMERKPVKKEGTSFQETMKNLEKKYSKVELAKIASIFSAMDLRGTDDKNDDQSTTSGSERD
jgi:hypothetical protein